jgi:hypothetical protein
MKQKGRVVSGPALKTGGFTNELHHSGNNLFLPVKSSLSGLTGQGVQKNPSAA